MLRALATCIYYVDRLFPRARVGGRESGQSYAAWEHETARHLLEEYSLHFGSLAGKSVLDIGCGLGGKTVAYAEAGADLIGVDIAKENVVEAVRFARARGVDVPFIVGDAEALPFPGGTFDVVVANDAMEHFPDPEKALGELSRVTRGGGYIFLFFTPWRSPLGSHLYDYIRIPWCHLLFPEALIEQVLTVVLERRGIEAADEEAARLIEEYRCELNRISVSRYHAILKAHPGLVTVMEELKPPKLSVLAPLTKVPLAGELFTGTVTAVLCKSG
jgi:ubiquinone/menaquinone biosynthesis C-methylase UbiE